MDAGEGENGAPAFETPTRAVLKRAHVSCPTDLISASSAQNTNSHINPKCSNHPVQTALKDKDVTEATGPCFRFIH